VLERHKRKAEEDRTAHASLMKENKSLLDSLDELEKKRQKIEHDLQSKETYIACVDSQLAHSKQALELESTKVCHSCLSLHISRTVLCFFSALF